MNIIEVIPIKKGFGVDTLSYFTSLTPPIGAIVEVPIRKKNASAIVVSVKKAEDLKSEIRGATFTLKKIEKMKSTEFFSKAFIETAEEASKYYATSIGSILNALTPDYIIKNIDKLKKGKDFEIKNVHEKYVSQGDSDERYGAWKSLIRQEFARKKSVFLLVPTIEDAINIFNLIEKGIEGYAFILHGGLSSKDIVANWNKIIKEEHPVIIVGTGGFLSISRNDIETIIVEKESNKAYKIARRPFLDFRYIVETFSKKRGIKIFYGDNVLRTETLYRESQGQLIQASPFKFRSLSTARDLLVNMKLKPFSVISSEVENLIQETRDESGQMIILCTRRGLSPSTICGDCQTIVLCNNCSLPVVLHKKTDNGKDKSFFMCHRCGERRSAEEYCKHCNSWKLTTIGIGIDTVEEKILELFPDIKLFKIDSDTVKTDEKARALIQKFKNEPGSVLLGTEMMLQYIHEKIENSAIISLDSLFTLPDFRIQEKILHTLIRIRSLTNENFIVQTRKPDEKVFEYGLKGNMSDFYREEIGARKKFNYPPFTTLIKITLEGKKDNIVKEMEEAQNLLEPFEVEVFPAFTHTVKGNYVLHGLIRIPEENWPNMDLVEKLRGLSPAISIKVDPETLL